MQFDICNSKIHRAVNLPVDFKQLSMKAIFLLLAFSLGLNTTIKGQTTLKNVDKAEIICFYNYYWQQDSVDPDHIRNERMILLVEEKTSLFYGYGRHFSDSVFLANPDINLSAFSELNPPRAISNMRIYKNHPAGNITTFDYVLPDMYQYEENLDLFDWTLSDETDVIHGYPVQKATTNFGGREWIAWFTPEIPISDGPYKFRGLPGLILHIEDSRQHHIFKIESIARSDSESQNIYLLTRSNIIKTNKQQFFKIRERFRQDVIGGLLSSGVPVHEDTDLDRAQKNMLRRNNPIELIVE